MAEDKNILNEIKAYRIAKWLTKIIRRLRFSDQTRTRLIFAFIIFIAWGGLYAYNNREKDFEDWSIVMRHAKMKKRRENIDRIPIMEIKINQSLEDNDKNLECTKNLTREYKEHKEVTLKQLQNHNARLWNVEERTLTKKELMEIIRDQESYRTSYRLEDTVYHEF